MGERSYVVRRLPNRQGFSSAGRITFRCRIVPSQIDTPLTRTNKATTMTTKSDSQSLRVLSPIICAQRTSNIYSPYTTPTHKHTTITHMVWIRLVLTQSINIISCVGHIYGEIALWKCVLRRLGMPAHTQRERKCHNFVERDLQDYAIAWD